MREIVRALVYACIVMAGVVAGGTIVHASLGESSGLAAHRRAVAQTAQAVLSQSREWAKRETLRVRERFARLLDLGQITLPVTLIVTSRKLPGDDVNGNAAPLAALRGAIIPSVPPAPSRPIARDFNKAIVAAKVRERLRDNLSSELLTSFGLFIYVSKAERGLWAQYMYVFAKDGADLKLLHDWPVSTGREGMERGPSGKRMSTSTPAGYFQFSPGRMFKRYRSVQWDAPMPNAMFLDWTNRGMETGIAVHGVVGRENTTLGRRASAGCIRLAPAAAETLHELIKTNYRGARPHFVFDRRTQTLSNRGELARRPDGSPIFSDGYRVLIFIENYGGEELQSLIF